MKWLLVLAGLLVGGSLGELPGAIIGALIAAGLLAWISKGRAKSTAVQPADTYDRHREGEALPIIEADPLARRVAILEKEVATLKRRLDQFAAGELIPERLETTNLGEPVAAGPAFSPIDAAATPARVPSPGTESQAAQPLASEPGLSTSTGAIAPSSIAGAPHSPGLVTRLVTAIKAWLFGGNTVARMGILVLLLGLSFLAKFAVDHDLLPPALRIVIIAAIALALLLVGWRLRIRRPPYAMLLQGAAVAALYLDVFAALRLYQLLPLELAFGLAVAICAFSCVLAVKQDALSLAVLGASGGFIAPLVVSTGSGSHVALFGYYLLLDLGIAAIALFRSWRVLYLVGFAFTFMVGGLWGYQYYKPEHYASVQPFLAAFVLLFIAIVVVESRKTPTRLAHAIDGTLVFGPPLVGFSAQAALVQGIPWAAAWSAVAFGALYLGLALWLRRSASLGRVFLTIGIGFLTLAIPLAFDPRVTSAVWALEGAGVVWFGVRHGRWLPLLSGLALQLIASVLLLDRLASLHTSTPFLNARWIGIALVAGAALFSAWTLLATDLNNHPRLSRILGQWVSPALLAWGLLWWLAGNVAEFDAWAALGDAGRCTAVLLLFALTATGLLLAAARAEWPHAGLAVQGLLPLLTLLAFAQSASARHPAQAWAGIGWLIAFAVHDRALRAPIWPHPTMLSVQHAWRLLLATVLLAWQASWLIERATHAAAWPVAIWGAVVALVLTSLHADRLASRWPIAMRPAAYHPGATSTVAVVLMGWLWASSFAPESLETGVRYLPILNPVDLAVAAAALALGVWWRQYPAPASTSPAQFAASGVSSAALRAGAIGLSLFVALNAIVLRAVAHYGGIAYNFDNLADSGLAQTAVSLLWGLSALATMVNGARGARRPIWLVGAVLLALVVGKLFLVDLSNWGGLTRVVSFLGVGALMLVIGYFAPMPPARMIASAGPRPNPESEQENPP